MEYHGYVYKGPQINCKECTERYLGCHDKCPAYQQARTEWVERKKMIKKQKNAAKQYDSFKIEATIKNKWR